jgi:hypothetical protein
MFHIREVSGETIPSKNFMLQNNEENNSMLGTDSLQKHMQPFRTNLDFLCWNYMLEVPLICKSLIISGKEVRVIGTCSTCDR